MWWKSPYSYAFQVANGTIRPVYKRAEEEADDFIANDIEILKGAALFNALWSEVGTYINSGNTLIQIGAFFKRMTPVDYVKQYPEFVHRLIEPWGLCEAVHPSHPNRKKRFEERIEELKKAGHEDVVVDPVEITVYKGDEVIKHITV